MSRSTDPALREELSALIDGALPDERRRALEERIEREPDVRRAYEELRETARLVRSLPPLAAPPELRRRLAAARPRGRLLGFSPWWTVAAAAAGVLLAVMLDRDEPTPAGRTVEAREETVTRPPEEDEADGGESVLRIEETAVGAKTGESVDPGAKARDPSGAPEPVEAAAEASEGALAGARAREQAEMPGAADRRGARAGDAGDLGAPAPAPAPAPADQAAEAGRDDAEAREAPAREKARSRGRAEAESSWRERAVAGERPRTPYERARYLGELEQLDGEALARHLAHLGERQRLVERSAPPPPSPEPQPEALRAQAAGEATPDGAVALRDPFEADRVRRLLLRVHDGPARAARAARQAEDAEGRWTVELELSPGELAGVRAWFAVLDGEAGSDGEGAGRATPLPPSAPSSPTASGFAEDAGRKGDERRRVRLLLRWAVPEREPEREPEQEPERPPEQEPDAGR